MLLFCGNNVDAEAVIMKQAKAKCRLGLSPNPSDVRKKIMLTLSIFHKQFARKSCSLPSTPAIVVVVVVVVAALCILIMHVLVGVKASTHCLNFKQHKRQN